VLLDAGAAGVLLELPEPLELSELDELPPSDELLELDELSLLDDDEPDFDSFPASTPDFLT